MTIRVSVFFIAVFFCIVNIASAQDKPVVAVLPFEVFAAGDLSHLQTETIKNISDQMENTGLTVITPDRLPEVPLGELGENLDAVREFGKKVEADFVVWGSMTWAEDRYSIDAKIIETDAAAPPAAFFAEGEGLENLLSVVRKLSQDLSETILKQERIAEIQVTGNERIEDDAVLKRVKTSPGDIYFPDRLTEDLNNVYAMGYFDDIRIESKDSANGKIIIFHIKEKPTIREILITGNSDSIYDDDEIKENINISTGSIFNIFIIKQEIKTIETLYKDKNYHNSVVTYKIKPHKNNQADLEILIEEGEKILIRKVIFEGNQSFSDKEIKALRAGKKGFYAYFPFSVFLKSGELGKMETSEKGIFSFITNSGELNIEMLNQDVAKITAFYHNHGYIRARVGEPQIDYEEEAIFIKIKIDEGPCFRTGKIDMEGDLIMPKEDLLKYMQIGKEEFLSRGVLRTDILALTDIYSDQGFYYAEILPKIDEDFDNQSADITFVIRQGNPVYFEKIIISGNTKTRDKVIRRELPISEQYLYSGTQLKRGIQNLYRLDYFEDIKVKTLKGSAGDKMILKIDVIEKPTGTFSFGGGYSSMQRFFATVSVSQRNFQGRGQILNVSAEKGGITDQFSLSFTEPWLFDIPLSATASVFDTMSDYPEYDRKRLGGSIGMGYPVYDYTRASITFVYETDKYTNISEFAPQYYINLGDDAEVVTSKVLTRLRYDSRDRLYNPTRGYDNSVTVTYAGDLLGGDTAFTKWVLEAGRYIPMFYNTVSFFHAKTGYVRKNSGGDLPTDQRFFLGGLNSLRGFEWNEISPIVLNELGVPTRVGGNKFIQFNVEYLIPLFMDAGLMGLVFYDTGNAFNNDEPMDLGDLRQSAGYGFRWYSPIGPIRIECGYILDPKPGENTGGNWQFTMGGAF